jgi:hypothetical protein
MKYKKGNVQQVVLSTEIMAKELVKVRVKNKKEIENALVKMQINWGMMQITK